MKGWYFVKGNKDEKVPQKCHEREENVDCRKINWLLLQMIKINVIFVHGIELLTFTEKLREIGGGPKFALSVLTRTALNYLVTQSTYCVILCLLCATLKRFLRCEKTFAPTKLRHFEGHSLLWWAVIQTILIRSSGRYSRALVSSFCTRLSSNERIFSHKTSCVYKVTNSSWIFEFKNKSVFKIILSKKSINNLLQFCTRWTVLIDVGNILKKSQFYQLC